MNINSTPMIRSRRLRRHVWQRFRYRLASIMVYLVP